MIVPGFIVDSVANFVRVFAKGFGIRLYGSSSGSVGLKPAASAGSTDFTLPPSTTAGGVPTDVAGDGVLTMVVPSGASAPLTLTAPSASTVPLTVKGAASQSANLQEWKNSSGTVLASIASDGTIKTPLTNGGTYCSVVFASTTGVLLQDASSGTAQTGGDIVGLLANGTYGLSALQVLLSTVNTNVNNLSNLSALANLYCPSVMEIPDSSTTAFPLTILIRDEEGHLIDLDSSPTVTAANAAGTDRSANLSSVTHSSTGVYDLTYTVSSTDTAESIRVVATGTVSSSARRAEQVTSVVDYDHVTILNAIKAQTDKLLFDGSNYVKSDPQTLANSGDFNATQKSSITTAVPAVTDATHGNAALLTAIQALDAGSGSGIHGVTVTFTDSDSAPVQNVTATVYLAGAMVANSTSDADGVASLNLDDGKYTVRYKDSGGAFNTGSTTIEVSANGQDFPVTLERISITLGAGDQTTGYMTVVDSSGNEKSGVTVTLDIKRFHAGDTGLGIDIPRATAVSDVNGLVQFPGLPRLAGYVVHIDGNSVGFNGITADAPTTPLVNSLGSIN